VGRQLGRLGPLTGQQVLWYAGPTCGGRTWAWSVGTQGTHVSQLLLCSISFQVLYFEHLLSRY
jgi:hypothetical protein